MCIHIYVVKEHASTDDWWPMLLHSLLHWGSPCILFRYLIIFSNALPVGRHDLCCFTFYVGGPYMLHWFRVCSLCYWWCVTGCLPNPNNLRTREFKSQTTSFKHATLNLIIKNWLQFVYNICIALPYSVNYCTILCVVYLTTKYHYRVHNSISYVYHSISEVFNICMFPSLHDRNIYIWWHDVLRHSQFGFQNKELIFISAMFIAGVE
jgi:hypothetical protein